MYRGVYILLLNISSKGICLFLYVNRYWFLWVFIMGNLYNVIVQRVTIERPRNGLLIYLFYLGLPDTKSYN